MRVRIATNLNLLRIFSLTVFAVLSSSARGGIFTTIDILSIANANLQATNVDFPKGLVTLGGVPFDIGTSGNNYYYSETAGPATTTTATVPINLSGVAGIHTLINTAFGETVPGTFASLTFTFSDASTFVKSLDGNVDIRDFYSNVFTNSINNTTTQNVFVTDTDGPAGSNLYRLDKQYIDLSAFSSKTLVSMTLTDSGSSIPGAPNRQRTFLSGVTAESISAVPEPSSFTMIASLAAGLLFKRRRESIRSIECHSRSY